MAIELSVHLEATGETSPGFVWWAETEAVPGFSAAADHLDELLQRSEEALRDIVGADVELEPKLIPLDDLDTAGQPELDASAEALWSGSPPAVRVFPPPRVAQPA